MARLPPVDPAEIQDPAVRRGFEDMVQRMGEVTENLAILAHKPIYVDLITSVSKAIDAQTEIDPVLKQLVELKVARLNGCEYSIDLLEGCLIRRDMTEAKLHELDFYEESTLYDERERLALRLAEQMVMDAVGETLFHQVRQSFSVIEILELVVSVALENFYSLVNRTLGLKPQGFRERAIAERAAAGASDPAG
ncbi:MAG: carboxymuconolactone decarboxylase family protein [Gemmatimonadota bacterium]